MISPTFCTSNAPIDGIFATPGIECISVLILPHYGAVGNHRCFIVDLSSASLIGMAFPNIVQCAARKLHCTSSQMVTMFNNELTRICDEHNMFHLMDKILCLCKFLPDNNFLLLMNSLDDEVKEYMLHVETYCSKFMIRHIEWSPTIGIRLSRRWLLHRVRLWMIGARSPDPCNMFQDCF
jgi:hypothetical protein